VVPNEQLRTLVWEKLKHTFRNRQNVRQCNDSNMREYQTLILSHASQNQIVNGLDSPIKLFDFLLEEEKEFLYVISSNT